MECGEVEEEREEEVPEGGRCVWKLPLPEEEEEEEEVEEEEDDVEEEEEEDDDDDCMRERTEGVDGRMAAKGVSA